MKRSAPAIFALLAVAAWAAGATSSAPASSGVTIRLAPTQSAAVTAEGFIPAELTVADPNNALPAAAQSVAIRRVAGGPTMYIEAAIAPGASGSFRVLLPMISVREDYTIRLLAGTSPDSPVVLQQQATAETDDVAAVDKARGTLINPPAYDEYIEDLPRWPGWVVRNVCLAIAGLLVALGAALLIHTPMWRVLAAGIIPVAASAVLVATLANCPSVVVRESGNTICVSTRRTIRWSARAAGMGPVYWRPQQFNADDMIYQPGRTLTLTLHPDEVRLFHKVD